MLDLMLYQRLLSVLQLSCPFLIEIFARQHILGEELGVSKDWIDALATVG